MPELNYVLSAYKFDDVTKSKAEYEIKSSIGRGIIGPTVPRPDQIASNIFCSQK